MKKIVAIMMRGFLSAIIILFVVHSAAAKITSDLEKKPPKENTKEKSAPSSKDDSAQAKEHFQKGVEYSRSDKADLAILEYRKALEFDPNLSLAYVNIGMSYIQKKDFDTAVQELKKAIGRDPKLKIARFNLWWAYRQKGKYDEGISELKKVLEIDPNDGNAYQNLGDSYLSDKKVFPDAIRAYAKGLALNKESVALRQKLGKAYELNGEWSKAVEQFQQAIDLNRTNLYSYLFLYITLMKTKEHAKAQEVIKKGLAVFQSDPLLADSSYKDIAHLLEYLLGKYPEKDLLSIKNPIIACQASYYIGMNYLFQNKSKEAIQHLEKAINDQINFISEYEYAKIELGLIQVQK
ncbi:MAG: tetratricopeptide repeat protein [bacterium]